MKAEVSLHGSSIARKISTVSMYISDTAQLRVLRTDRLD